MPGNDTVEEDGKNAARREKKARKKAKLSKEQDAAGKPVKTILRNKDTPPSRSKVVIREEENKIEGREETKRGISVLTRNTPVLTINTPLRGNPDSPLKPYKHRMGGRNTRSSLNRLTTSAYGASSTIPEIKPVDVQAGKKALIELFSSISMGTRMLEFKDMLQVKVAIGLESHIPKETLEELDTFEKVIDELSVLWKINRADLDLLESLLNKIGMLERFGNELEKYKNTIRYNDLPASSEREVTTIISSLHNLLQGSDESSGSYTTICFLHYGQVYNFNRAKLSCMKNELATFLRIHNTQMTYIAKVPVDTKGYITVFQLPCSVSKKMVVAAKKNHPVLMSLGLKGIQITGSDGLRYSQSLGYLQEKVEVSTQTVSTDALLLPSRRTRTAPTMPPQLPILEQPKSSDFGGSRPSTKGFARSPNTFPKTQTPGQKSFSTPWMETPSAPTPIKDDPSLVPLLDPDEEKFEKRIKLLRSSLNGLSQSSSEELISVLLEQIQLLHKNIVSLKKDLREKSRELNANQGYVQKAEKEIKSMEMRLETKAHEISEVNHQLIKKMKRVVNENARLKEMLRQLDAEVDIHRQLEKENRFGNSIKAIRLSRPIPQGVL